MGEGEVEEGGDGTMLMMMRGCDDNDGTVTERTVSIFSAGVDIGAQCIDWWRPLPRACHVTHPYIIHL